MTTKPVKDTPVIGVGMPAYIKLELFGKVVFDAFGDWPYLVGSALRGKDWRDVDVRLLMEDATFDAMFGKQSTAINQKWNAYCWAFAELGKVMTGLPIDFQIERQSESNTKFPTQARQPLIAYGNWITQEQL